MLIDLTFCVSKNHIDRAFANEKMTAFGHIGTHFDVTDKSFDLQHAICPAIVFDVSNAGKDIDSLPLCDISEGDFVMLYTGFIDKTPYGTPQYFSDHPQLSLALIDSLLDKRVRYIGIDAAGIRRGEQHTPMDKYCAHRGVFVIENLCNLQQVLTERHFTRFTAFVFPVRFEGLSGLPCRVAAQV